MGCYGGTGDSYASDTGAGTLLNVQDDGKCSRCDGAYRELPDWALRLTHSTILSGVFRGTSSEFECLGIRGVFLG